MADALQVGLSALTAHRRAMEVISHNIANAATPGYSRQRVEYTTPVPEETRPGTLGRGVIVDSINRDVDVLVTERFRSAHTELGRLQTLGTTLDDLELVYNEPGEGGLSAVINATFATLEDLSNNPESQALRTGAVQQMETFAATLRAQYDRLARLREDLQVQMDSEISAINRITAEVSDLNQQIKRLALSGQNPNDLFDQREVLLNDLSTRLDVRVVTSPLDYTVRVDLAGSSIVSNSESYDLARSADGDGNLITVFDSTLVRAYPGGGVVGGLEELSSTVLPNALEELDSLALIMMREFNHVHASGTSNTYDRNLHSAEFLFPTGYSGYNLDDPLLVKEAESPVGIPEAFLPQFTDAQGNQIPANLTVNVLDTTSGSAKKFIVHYEPGTTLPPAGRSLDDLVSAINTGIGGGFTVYPASPGGVNGVTARLVPVSGGLAFQLLGDPGTSIDFSPALDLRPADTGWTGPQMTVSGSDAALAGLRITAEVQNGGTELALYTRDPVSGGKVDYPGPGPSVIDLTAASPGVLGALTVTWGAGTFVDGATFTLNADASGSVAHQEDRTWTAGNAGFKVLGRYTGEQTFAPGRSWTMEVLQGGVIGAAAGTLAPNNPPVVSVTYWDGPEEAPVSQTVQMVLDSSLRPGDQVAIADGVYLTFDAGNLSTGDRASWIVDAQPDSAGLLSALGVGSLLSGSGAADIHVNEEIARNPGLLAVSRTRSEGDNSNLLALMEVRDSRAFGDGVTLDEFYQAQVSDVAVRVQQNGSLLKTQELLHQSLEGRRDEISGVSIDEEVGMLILTQQAYSAAGKVIAIARENIDTLLRLMDG